MYRITLSHVGSPDQVAEFDAVGWDKTEFKISRSSEFFGLFYDYSTPLQFFGSEASYIKGIYDNEGVYAEISILIEVQDEEQQWLEFFTGKLNLSRMSFIDVGRDRGSLPSDTPEPLLVEVYIDPSGIAMDLINRRGLEVDLGDQLNLFGEGMSSIDPTPLTLHGKAIIIQSLYEQTDFFSDILSFAGLNTWYYIPTMEQVYDELDSGGFATVARTETLDPALVPSFYENTTLDPIEITFNVTVNSVISTVLDSAPNSGADAAMYLRIATGADASGSPVTIAQTTTIPDNGVGTVNVVDNVFTGTVTVAPGDFAFCYWAAEITNAFITSVFDVEFATEAFEINVQDKGIRADTGASGMLVHEALARVCEYVTRANGVLYSEHFGRVDSQPRNYGQDGCGSLYAILSGLQVRGFDDYPKVSLSWLFSSLNAIESIGLGVEVIAGTELVRVEPKSYFFNSTDTVLEFENVPNIRIEVATDLYYNSVDVGYREWETDDKNALDDTHTTRQFGNKLGSVVAAYDVQSDLVASGYAIERTRRAQFDEEPSTGTKFDTSTFAICVRRDGAAIVSEKDEAFSSVTNLYSPETAYNLRITPVRNLIKHLPWVGGSLLRAVPQEWRFISGQINTEAATTLAASDCEGVPITEVFEGQDLEQAVGEATLFIPEYIIFTVPMKVSEIATLKATNNRYKLVSLSDTTGTEWRGYLYELSYQPLTQLATIKLLRYD